jgi:very-short-patch-repair endonuclease
MTTKEKQLTIASNIDKYTNYSCRIIRNETEPYVLFCATDIGKICDIKHIRGCNLLSNDKVICKTNSNGGAQSSVYMTYIGLLKILTKSRKRSVHTFANAIGVDIFDISFACIESSSIDKIIKTFNSEEMIEQYKIENYIIDLYLPKYKLAIECDEKQHNTMTTQIKDNYRENQIILLLNCKFIRYNPYDKNFNIFILLNEIFIHIKNYDK